MPGVGLAERRADPGHAGGGLVEGARLGTPGGQRHGAHLLAGQRPAAAGGDRLAERVVAAGDDHLVAVDPGDHAAVGPRLHDGAVEHARHQRRGCRGRR